MCKDAGENYVSKCVLVMGDSRPHRATRLWPDGTYSLTCLVQAATVCADAKGAGQPASPFKRTNSISRSIKTRGPWCAACIDLCSGLCPNLTTHTDLTRAEPAGIDVEPLVIVTAVRPPGRRANRI
jgi:hypothetical protein